MKRTRSKNWGTPDHDGNVVIVNVRESFSITSAAGLCHVKSVQPSVFSHTAWQSCTIGSQSHQFGNRRNPIKPAKSTPVMTPLWVAVGLRRIWWFLLYNFRTVSHQLYLQLDMSGNPTSHVPSFKGGQDFSHHGVPPQTFPRYYRCAGWNNWMEQFQMHELNTSSQATNICAQNICIHSIWWGMQCWTPWLCNKFS